jgi:hypothetical protein
VEAEMELENRYIVLKRRDVDEHLNEDEKITLSVLCETVDDGRRNKGKPSIDALVIESDWPEYGLALDAIVERVDS